MKRAPEQIADEWLVLRCQEGSPVALDTLLRKWHKPLWLRACRLTFDDEAAHDIAQESLMARSAAVFESFMTPPASVPGHFKSQR